jgi:hypothetical protein
MRHVGLVLCQRLVATTSGVGIEAKRMAVLPTKPYHLERVGERPANCRTSFAGLAP